MNLAREQEALAHVRSGRRDRGLEILAVTYGRQLTACIARLVHDRERAQDIYQDVFLRVLRKIDTFEGRNNSSLLTWICRIAYHRVLDEQARLALPASPVAVGDMTVLDELFGPSHPTMTDEEVAMRRTLEQCLAELNPQMRARVMLRFYFGLSHAEIGEAIDKDPAAVQVSLSRLQQKLRKCLRKGEHPGRA